MLLSIYVKKLDETFSAETDQFPQVTRDYLMRNGFSQRLRDVHASIKREDYSEGPTGTEAWQNDVRAAIQGALDQMKSGDIPGERGPASPETVKTRELVNAMKTAGLDIKAVNPEKLVAWLKRQTDMGKAA